MNRILVALFKERSRAEPIQKLFLQAGIAAEIHEENLLQRLWFVSKQAAGVRLEVPAEQFDRAERLLLAWDSAGADLSQAVRCPECKSLRVNYPQFADHSVMTNMAAGVAAELGLVEKDYYCEACHYTWPKKQEHPQRQRHHLAPYYFIEGVETVHSSPGAAGSKS